MNDDALKRGAVPTVPTAPVPSGRWSRLGRLGTLATGVAGGMLAEGARQLASGKRPAISDLLLTPANARRVADQLAQLRGAAMKVGQLLSMDAGDLLPPEVADILARLRADAVAMPMSQVVSVLDTNWGAGWNRQFEQFSFTPVAAASIGQVHLGRTRDGRHVAVKIQYPGVRASIDSDVDNVATLLRLSGLLPKNMDIAPLLADAKRQLHAEADYLQEAASLSRYATLLAGADQYALPDMHADLTTENVLTMSCMDGVPIESLVTAPQPERDRVTALLMQLLFREIFEFRLVQTDPNFANYRYDTGSRQLILLDFGATRDYSAAMADSYQKIMFAGAASDVVAIEEAACEIGYFRPDTSQRQRSAVIDIFMLACEPLRHIGAYDFGASNLALRIRDAGLAFQKEKDFRHVPPTDALFLHRKLGGLYLLAARLKARVDVRAMLLASAPERSAPELCA
jgi:predicted unusual protein kinase regulating ubiquinone biosynthesis (AarF/ABC1/UbiB family)